MKTTINNEDFYIRFEHNIEKKKKSTTCIINKKTTVDGKTEYVPISTGLSKCNLHEDKYDKDKGRRLSLERALINSHCFIKKDRTQIWNLYFATVKSILKKV